MRAAGKPRDVQGQPQLWIYRDRYGMINLLGVCMELQIHMLKSVVL